MSYGKTCGWLDIFIYIQGFVSVFFAGMVSFMDHHIGFVTGVCAMVSTSIAVCTFVANERRKNRLERIKFGGRYDNKAVDDE